ncbi:hypothetical protein GYMLUDRAFT_73617 [Collybiopsis luxurians FD-317 M1]|uniref:Uncharacterized protein n=1 Tax=Collybiopsis luxurians FD-317 M1 TaxID=944289 RepID=A0A0D0CE22_9AGAR|nr:hypothetical protein GYMLUDRAFT_73617 [Collybiopsis luxurians FD-317 M1]
MSISAKLCRFLTRIIGFLTLPVTTVLVLVYLAVAISSLITDQLRPVPPKSTLSSRDMEAWMFQRPTRTFTLSLPIHIPTIPMPTVSSENTCSNVLEPSVHGQIYVILFLLTRR